MFETRCDRDAGGGRGPRPRRAAACPRAAQARRPRRGARQAPAGRPVVRAAPRDRRHRGRHLGRRLPARRAPPQDESAGRGGHPGGLGVRAGAGRRRPGGLHDDRDEADRRRPRPPAPAPEDLAARRGPGRGAVEGPPGRPGHPPPLPRGRRDMWTTSSPRGWPRAGSPRSRRRSRWRSRSTTPSSSSSARRPARSPGTSPCATPPPASTTAPATSTSPATPSTSPPSTTSSASRPPQLKALGDTDDLEIRKAKALGVIATQQATLDLVSLTGDNRSDDGDTSLVAPVATTPARRRHTVLYAHASLTDLLHLSATLDGTDESGAAVGRVEKLGPATVEKIRDWLGPLRPRGHPARARPELAAPPWTGTTRPRRSARSSSSATGTASSPGAPSTPAGPTRTTSSPTSPWTRAGPRARPTPTTWPASADDITAARPAAAGDTDDGADGTYEWHGPHGRSFLVTPLGTLEIHPN